ncbi:hypothetical protein Ahu01nite_048550 [Winogradskya humida]|uniref:Uncharacterized protein n=1 Tax=Winogradskya humida TaxID=113566 RepID=A0ABQ3ZT66_9ACTN|nr:hypothetical protein Ahu01nite_048550 [Actinoplanes humidus]
MAARDGTSLCVAGRSVTWAPRSSAGGGISGMSLQRGRAPAGAIRAAVDGAAVPVPYSSGGGSFARETVRCLDCEGAVTGWHATPGPHVRNRPDRPQLSSPGTPACGLGRASNVIVEYAP